MGHPVAFGGCSVILGQAGLHIGFGRSGMVELFSQLPDHLRPEAVDTTRGVATVFPALSVALIRLEQGDRPGAEEAYALAGLVARGLTNKQIGRALYVSERTAENLQHILTKLGFSNRSQIAAWAMTEYPLSSSPDGAARSSP